MIPDHPGSYHRWTILNLFYLKSLFFFVSLVFFLGCSWSKHCNSIVLWPYVHRSFNFKHGVERDLKRRESELMFIWNSIFPPPIVSYESSRFRGGASTACVACHYGFSLCFLLAQYMNAVRQKKKKLYTACLIPVEINHWSYPIYHVCHKKYLLNSRQVAVEYLRVSRQYLLVFELFTRNWCAERNNNVPSFTPAFHENSSVFLLFLKNNPISTLTTYKG